MRAVKLFLVALTMTATAVVGVAAGNATGTDNQAPQARDIWCC